MTWWRRVPAMTVLWIAMGATVTAALFFDARDDQARCEAGNDFRRRDLPLAFDTYTQFLGEEFGADQGRIDDARARFAPAIDGLFPEADCPLLW